MVRLHSFTAPTQLTNFVKYSDKYIDDSFADYFEKVKKPVIS